MSWVIHPKGPRDYDTVADDLAAIIWELRKRLARTEHLFLVDEVCAEFDIEIKDVAA